MRTYYYTIVNKYANYGVASFLMLYSTATIFHRSKRYQCKSMHTSPTNELFKGLQNTYIYL